MLKLLKMELRLNIHPLLYFFSLCGAMVMIPSYPYIIAIWYSVLQLFIYLQSINETRAREFSANLPIKRADIVSVTTLVIVMFQLLNYFVAAIFAYPSILINPNHTNYAGLDCNFTFFGVALMSLAMFNLAFIPSHFKSGYKIYLPMLWGLLAFLGTYALSETVIQTIPVLKEVLDGNESKHLWARLTVFAIGVILYPISTLLANKIAIKKFEKVNL